MRFSTVVAVVLFATIATAAPSTTRASSSHAAADVLSDSEASVSDSVVPLEDNLLPLEPPTLNDVAEFENIITGNRYASLDLGVITSLTFASRFSDQTEEHPSPLSFVSSLFGRQEVPKPQHRRSIRRYVPQFPIYPASSNILLQKPASLIDSCRFLYFASQLSLYLYLYFIVCHHRFWFFL